MALYVYCDKGRRLVGVIISESAIEVLKTASLAGYCRSHFSWRIYERSSFA